MESLDEVFRLLTPERRRYALYYLEEQNGPVSVSELAETIEQWEGEGGQTAPPDENYDEILLTLEHRHLPKAAQAEFVEYDAEERVVEVTGSPAELSVAEAIEQPRRDDIVTLL